MLCRVSCDFFTWFLIFGCTRDLWPFLLNRFKRQPTIKRFHRAAKTLSAIPMSTLTHIKTSHTANKHFFAPLSLSLHWKPSSVFQSKPRTFVGNDTMYTNSIVLRIFTILCRKAGVQAFLSHGEATFRQSHIKFGIWLEMWAKQTSKNNPPIEMSDWKIVEIR